LRRFTVSSAPRAGALGEVFPAGSPSGNRFPAVRAALRVPFQPAGEDHVRFVVALLPGVQLARLFTAFDTALFPARATD